MWSIPPLNVKSINKHTVLDLIRFSPNGILRVELSRRMGLTRAAVTAIVSDLLSTRIIREAGGINVRSGRPPVVLEIDPTRGFVVGIDFGASHLSILIADLGAHILEEAEIAIDIQDGPKTCIDQADQLLHELLKKVGRELKDILAIGVGVPGPIVSDAGMVLAPPIMPGWDRFPIRDTLEKMWGCPVSLSNDSELGALGEWAAGAGRGEQNLAYIKIGTGIGAGLLLEGQIYRGITGSAGEIGHLTIEENGPLCACGNHGCLEAIAGGRAIALQAREAARNDKRTQLANSKPIESITARNVASAARLGDLLSQQILSRAGTYVGIAIAGGYRNKIRHLDGSEFATQVDHILGLYDPAVNQVQLNLLDSHDTPRFLTSASGDLASFELALLFMFTFPGAPCIYYGDEIGLDGRQDPDCRKSFPWDVAKWNETLLKYTKECISLRHRHPALRRGTYHPLYSNENIYAFGRKLQTETLMIVLNAGEQGYNLDFAVETLGLPDGSLETLFGKGNAVVQTGRVSGLKLAPRSAIVLKRE